MTNPRKPRSDRSLGKGKGMSKVNPKGTPQAMPPPPAPVRADIQIERVLEPLLATVRKSIYQGTHKDTTNSKLHFHRDRRQLLHALSWPAHWLQQRNLIVTADHYRRIIERQLAEIVEHGDRASYQAYFPRYLLKCLQSHFRHRGDLLYEEVKAISYAIPGVVERLAALEDEPESSPSSQRQLVENLAALHGILHARKRSNPDGKNDRNEQLRLF